MKVYVYCLLDPRNEGVRYVGITSNPRLRLNRHNYDSRFDYHKSRWIHSLHKLNLKPIMDIIDECDETNWQDREKYWIKIYKDLGYDLTNSSVGGKGGLSPSEETREKMSIAKLGKPIRLDIMQKTLAKGWGRKKTEEERCKISSSQIGRIFSQETKQKMVNAWKLRKLRNVK